MHARSCSSESASSNSVNVDFRSEAKNRGDSWAQQKERQRVMREELATLQFDARRQVGGLSGI
jgi:hypothetical protein